MSTYNDLLTAVQATIEGIPLLWNLTPIRIIVSEEPLNREVIEPQPLPNLFLGPPSDHGERVEQAATENLMDVTYTIDFSIVAAGNAEFKANLPQYMDLRETIRKAVQRIYYPSVPGMWFVAPKPKQVLNIDSQRDNYDLSILSIDFIVTEPAIVITPP